MRSGLLSALVLVGALSAGAQNRAAAASVPTAVPSVPTTLPGGLVEPVYYYHGHHYPYHYQGRYYMYQNNGRYYQNRAYNHGHWRYY